MELSFGFFILWLFILIVVIGESTINRRISTTVFSIILLILSLANFILSDETNKITNKQKYKTDIISVKSDKKFSGGLFVIYTSNNYIVYTIDNDGGIKQKTLPISYTTIYEDSKKGEGYLVLQEKVKLVKSKLINITLKMNTYNAYVIHVPKGTVKREFAL